MDTGTYEVVEEENVVEREAPVVERECLALVWRGRDDDLGDAPIFELGAFQVSTPRRTFVSLQTPLYE